MIYLYQQKTLNQQIYYLTGLQIFDNTIDELVKLEFTTAEIADGEKKQLRERIAEEG